MYKVTWLAGHPFISDICVDGNGSAGVALFNADPLRSNIINNIHAHTAS